MGMPIEPLLDIMRRSKANLAFVEARAEPEGPYEVTQLVNTFLGALAHPFEAMRDDLMSLSLAEAAALLGWPNIDRERPTDSEPKFSAISFAFSERLRPRKSGIPAGLSGTNRRRSCLEYRTPKTRRAKLGRRHKDRRHAAISRLVRRADRALA